MSEQIFISYRREGGDVTAKLICEALKNRGYTVFYDFDSIQGGYFDERIYQAIEECNDFVLVLPPHSLDRCVNENDWVRLEIRHAIEHNKNIIPIFLHDFSFPKELPNDISRVSRYNCVIFSMPYFDAVMDAIVKRLTSVTYGTNAYANAVTFKTEPSFTASAGLEFTLNEDGNGYSVSQGLCHDTSVIIPGYYNGKLVTTIRENAFSGNTYLKTILIPDSVTNIEKHAFQGCSCLTNVTLTRYLKKLGSGAFTGCCALSCIDLPQGITRIEDWTFYGCSSIRSITIPDIVTVIGESAFAECNALKRLTLPSNLIAIMKDAFRECSQLDSVTIPKSIVRIGEQAFMNCSALKEINSRGSAYQFARIIFGNNWAPEHISVVNCKDRDYRLAPQQKFDKTVSEQIHSTDRPNQHTHTLGLKYSLINDGNAYSVSRGRCSQSEIVIPKSYLGKPVTHIEFEAFAEISSLTSVVIPDSVTDIGDRAFCHCSSLASLNIPCSVVRIGEDAFIGCSSLTAITIPESVKSIEMFAFDICTSLNLVNYLGTVEQWKNIEFGIHPFPISISTIYCADGEYSMPPQYLFSDSNGIVLCQGIRSENEVVIPKYYNSKEVTGIGECAFVSSPVLSSVNIPDSVKSIGAWAFSDCPSLASIVIPDGVKSIEDGTFSDCTSLLSVTIPNSITVIETGAFANCSALTSITLPANLSRIGSCAFVSCISLEVISYQGTKEQWESITLGADCFPEHLTVIQCLDGNIQHN